MILPHEENLVKEKPYEYHRRVPSKGLSQTLPFSLPQEFFVKKTLSSFEAKLDSPYPIPFKVS
jgi:hypothetical protein